MSNSPPKPGLCSVATINRVIDGDTIEVTISKKVTIRLLDCYAPEMHGIQRDDGVEAKNYCQKLIDNAHPGVLIHVPTDEHGYVKDILTLGRVLGEIWVKLPDGTYESLAKLMVNGGHATPTKST